MKPLFKQKIRLTGHSGSVYALEAYKSTQFFSGASDGILAKWDTTLTDSGDAFLRLADAIYSIKYIKSLNKLLVGQGKGGVHVINLDSGKEEKLIQLHTSPIFVIAYYPKHQLIFTGSSDGGIRILNHAFELVHQIELSSGKIRNITFSAINDQCIIGCGDGTICIISLSNFQIVKQWQGHQPGFGVNALCISPDGKYLLSGSRDAMLNIYNTTSYELEKSIPAHNYAIYDIAYHASGNFFATASRDKSVKIWEADNFNLIVRLDKESHDGHHNSVNKLLWVDDNLITTGDDRSIIVWQAELISKKEE